MKSILNDSKSNSKLEIIKDKPANVLKRIKMKVADWLPNRNGRVYPKSLWENVVNSDYIKEMINTHTLFGESSHPEERLEVDLSNVSHAINDLWIDRDGVYAQIDILPTPQGKIINELINYGSEIGISSRGQGSVMSNGEVDPDDYTLVTWDIVMRPSVAAARLDPRLVESAAVAKKDDVKVMLDEYSSSIRDDKIQYLDESVKNSMIIESIDEFINNSK